MVDVNNAREFYNNIASLSWSVAPTQHYHIGIYENETDTIEEAQNRTVEYFDKKLCPGKNDFILDIGCGSGLSAIQIVQSRDCNIVGINISENQLELGMSLVKKHGLSHKIKLMKMDVHKMSFKENVFDGAYALESIMHMDREKVLNEVHRVLKKGSLFTLCDWYIKKPLTLSEEKLLESTTCGRYLNIDEYYKLFHNSLFERVEIDDWSLKVLPTYKVWSTVTKKMEEEIPEDLLKKIEESCKEMAFIAKEKLGYFQLTCKIV